MKKPLIGITSGDRYLYQTDNYSGVRVSYSMAQVSEAISQAGGLPVIIPVHDPVQSAAYIDHLDGLVLQGGADISPQFYDQEPTEKIQRFDPRRDKREIALLRAAIDRQLPILGLCRGMQLANIVRGGSLFQDLSDRPETTIAHVQLSDGDVPSHRIYVKEDSRLSELLPNQTMINSYHHQAIDQVGEGLVVSGWAEDGVIEAIESVDPDFNFLGVQYHPEQAIDYNPVHFLIFRDFLDRVHTNQL